MAEEQPEKRVFVGIRLRPSSLDRVTQLATSLGITKSEALRRCFAAGLPQLEAQIRPARPAPKR